MRLGYYVLAIESLIIKFLFSSIECDVRKCIMQCHFGVLAGASLSASVEQQHVGNCPQPFRLAPQGRMQTASDWNLQVHNPEGGTGNDREGGHLTTIYSSYLS